MTDAELSELYKHAQSLVFPSLMEGFGLPPLEAMQCGCPVITSNVSSLPEVVGDAALMIDPCDDAAAVKAFEMLYLDEPFRMELKRKGLERAMHFSWEKCVDIMVKEMIKD